MKVYLDNAATTPLDRRVIDAMIPFMEQHFGNPSSIHTHGREVKIAIERARKKVAGLLNASPSEIFFTSGGTEADNTYLRRAVTSNGVRHIITSAIEHHAVSHTAEDLEKRFAVKISYVDLDKKGKVDMAHLESLVRGSKEKTLVSLMHANNEVATINDVAAIAELCKEFGAMSHSDTVQTMGHLPIDFKKIRLDAAVGAAHKFHGPKGSGFLYMSENAKVTPFITGGSQERNMRGGTENVYGIIGLVTALEIAVTEMESHRLHVAGLKRRMRDALIEKIPGVQFNGDSADIENSLYTVLSLSLPPASGNEMLMMNLDIQGVSASGGSACSSGSNTGSHVLRALGHSPERAAARFSFSRMTTQAEVDYAVGVLASICAGKAAAESVAS